MEQKVLSNILSKIDLVVTEYAHAHTISAEFVTYKKDEILLDDGSRWEPVWLEIDMAAVLKNEQMKNNFTLTKVEQFVRIKHPMYFDITDIRSKLLFNNEEFGPEHMRQLNNIYNHLRGFIKIKEEAGRPAHIPAGAVPVNSLAQLLGGQSDDELTKYLSDEMTKEIDKEILAHLLQQLKNDT